MNGKQGNENGNAAVPLVDAQETSIVINPQSTAGCFSHVFFSWMGETLNSGSKRPLQSADLFSLNDENNTEKLVDCIATEWKEEGKMASDSGMKPQLWKAVSRMIPVKDFVKLVVLSLLSSACCFGVLVLLWFFLRDLDDFSSMGYFTTCLYIIGIGSFTVVRALSVHHKDNVCEIWGMRLKVAITGIVYRKILVVTRHELENAVCKSTVNLVCYNAGKMVKSVMALGMLISAAFEIIVSICILFFLISWKALVGAGIFLIVVVYIVLISGKMSDLVMLAGKLTDQRLTLLSEVISRIREVKMFGLERNFTDKVKRIRRKEIGFHRLKSYILSSFMTLRYTARSVGALISFSLMILTGFHLHALQIFTLLTGLSILKFAVCANLADSLRYLVDVRLALKKAQAFLEHDVAYHQEVQDNLARGTNPTPSKEMSDDAQKQGSFQRKRGVTFNDRERFQASGCALLRRRLLSNIINPRHKNRISFSAFTCTWKEGWTNKAALKNVNLEIEGNELVVVTGPVGSGKSSLLLSIIEEVPPYSGKITTVGRIAYVSHTPWVFSATVRENIVFGRSFSQYLYKQVIEVCDLSKDLMSIPHGDMTKLGQHGVSLSGGQRARVSLARALYSEADIYLFDDPLSSVDAKVGKRLFERCICGMLSDRMRILATHQMQFVKKADRVVVLNRGKVTYQGSPQNIPDGKLMPKVPKIGRKMRWKSVYAMVRSGKGARQRRGSSITGTLDSVTDIDMEGGQSLQALQEAEEDRKAGSVGFTCYLDYWKAGLNPGLFVALILLFCLTEVSLVLPTWWLSRMADMSHDQQKEPGNLKTYAALVFLAPLATFLASFCFYHTTLRAANTLHERMTEGVIKSYALFFDTNSTGRILNRFTRDVGLMDKALPTSFLRTVQLGLFSLTACLVPVATNYWMLAGALPLMAIYVYYARFYLKSSRELKRLESLKCSPLYAHISQTVFGLETIRTCNAESQFLRQFYRYQDKNTQALFMVVSSERWVGLRMDMVCSIYITVVAAGALAIGGSPALVGLALTFAMETLVTTQSVVRSVSEVENMMTSVERVLAYSKLAPEPGYKVDRVIPDSWPQEGRLQFENMSLEYTEGGVQVLKDITLNIAPKEKVGIVGRSGAGKSSIIAALFRMPGPKGRVLIDGVDIATLNLQVARRAMAVITQNPVLFSGTLRKNMDPFDRFLDEDLWSALEQVQMKALVADLPGELDYEINESGSNFSVGQRQLLCLVRALLQKTKIVIMDEATANVDFETDQMVQQVVLEHFQDCTVLVIAHKLNTVIKYDKSLVLAQGRVVEFDEPQVLLENRDGLFAQMARTHDETLMW